MSAAFWNCLESVRCVMGTEPDDAGFAAPEGVPIFGASPAEGEPAQMETLQCSVDRSPSCSPDCSSECSVEQWIERDESLVPREPSAFLVEPTVLDPAEVAALLADLDLSLAEAALATAVAAATPSVGPGWASAAACGLAGTLFADRYFNADDAETSPSTSTTSTSEGTSYEPH